MSPSLVIITQESVEGFDGLSLETLHRKEWFHYNLVFQHLGYPRTSFLVSTSHKILICETPKWYSMVRIQCFGISAPGIPKDKFPCIHKS